MKEPYMAKADSPFQTLLKTRFLVGSSIPSSGGSLAKALNSALRKVVGPKANEDAVSVTMDAPPNIELLQANLSGTRISLSPDTKAAAESQVSTDVTSVKDCLPATLDKLMVEAHPLIVDGIPAEFDLQVESVPFDWVTDTSGQVWIGANQDDLSDMSGEFAARIETTALKQVVREAVKVGAAKQGFTLQDLDFTLQQQGQKIMVVGYAKVKRSFISAKADAKAMITYDPKTFTLTIDKIEVGSGNPAIAMVLRMAEGKIERFQGKKIDLNRLLAGTGQQLKAADVTVSDHDVRVTGKFA